jgi:hypothetical protein
MAVDRVIQELLDLNEPPDNGNQATPQSDFGASRSTGSDPHVGFDMNRGRGVQPHGRVTSPVYGRIKDIKPGLGRIVIEEWDPVTHRPTGYDVEILHPQTQTVEKDDPVKPKQQIGTQGDVGAPGAFHAHVQVVRSDDRTRTPLNPMRHLFEYHHPGEPIPPLPQFEPQQVPPREKRGSAPQSGDQARPAPSGAPSSNDAPAGAMSTQLSPGTPIPGAEGPTVIGGPGPLRPLVPLSPSRSSGPAHPTTPAVDPTLPPLRFAPETPQRVGPFEVPGLFRSDAFGGPPVASPTGRTGTNPSTDPCIISHPSAMLSFLRNASFDQTRCAASRKCHTRTKEQRARAILPRLLAMPNPILM